MTGSEVAFAAIGATGLVLLILSFVLGELFEHETDLSHEVDVGNAAETAAGSGADMAQVPSWLSMKVITASMVGFGSFGFVAAASGFPDVLSWPIAGAGFFAIGMVAYQLVVKPLARQQSNSLLSHHAYVGCEGVLNLNIPEGGSGQVVFNDRQGAHVSRMAVSSNGAALPKGLRVLIIDVTLDGTLVVDHHPLSELEA
ncbi:MAG TPA: hypothetical protein VJM46_02870 [Candidatus Saccharimonadales bacterium]|nr:hypothetical protein [Candidatus Saccharimonadales bacterium]